MSNYQRHPVISSTLHLDDLLLTDTMPDPRRVYRHLLVHAFPGVLHTLLWNGGTLWRPEARASLSALALGLAHNFAPIH